MSGPEAIDKGATLSDCGAYRYLLLRCWDQDEPGLPFVMLNPSTADAEADDPTIRRCMAFARREGFGGIFVANLYGFRATDPSRLALQRDPLGPDNLRTLDNLARNAAANRVPIVCAWGAFAGHVGIYTAGRLIRQGAHLRCLGKTKQGHPKHPLYVKADAPLVAFP